ncbi:DUF3618 domain-containing protein [Microbispora sp. NBRC 16548]|uniref:DUF3618 domain-containing protein n=1 Tax=Microbispora sp. NBRC 16548 TaxID=3030994 RepID=UPI0024A44428|nr:DUF3618 domain-containing protein [Microbispora sp. NBRC 16548]GLX03789.1 hypothetical protein Misp03_07160 [Microbispora sp. NBRC 16548]
MTETEPGAARPNAGTVGVHRQDVSEPVTEPESLNAVRQSRPGPEPVAAARDTETRGEHEEKGHDEIAEVRQEIERTRDHLGDTIEALAAKADVKARAQERVHATTAAARARVAGVTGRVREATPQPLRGAAGRVGEQAKRRSGLIAAAGAAGTALLLLRRITRSQGRMTRPGVSGMFQKPGISGKGGVSRMRGFGGARTGRGMLGTSGKIGMPRGGFRMFGSRMFGAKSRFGGIGPLGGKGAFGGKRTPGGMSMFGGKRTPGGMSMFGRKSRFGGTSMRGMFGRSRVFGGRRMFPQPRRTLMRRFAHR